MARGPIVTGPVCCTKQPELHLAKEVHKNCFWCKSQNDILTFEWLPWSSCTTEVRGHKPKEMVVYAQPHQDTVLIEVMYVPYLRPLSSRLMQVACVAGKNSKSLYTVAYYLLTMYCTLFQN